MKVYRLETIGNYPVSIEQAWQFFSDPRNLKLITPEYMDFEILETDLPVNMYAGQVIKYKIRPFPWIKLTWVTEITQVNAPNFFVDEQRSGPYSFWHHQHHFHRTELGIQSKDIVHYAIPLGILGRAAHFFFIRKRLEYIFRYRHQKLIEILQNHDFKKNYNRADSKNDNQSVSQLTPSR